MQIHENTNREGCRNRRSTRGRSPTERSIKTENSQESYLSLSSCSYQQETGTFDSIMSGESLFKVFNFEPTNNYQDSEKCACFWEHLKKYTNIKPVDCTLVKDTRDLKKKKTQTVKTCKEETISLNSPDFPWEQLYEELRKRKIYFDLGVHKKCGTPFDEYEYDDIPDNLVLLSLWKPKSCKKEVGEEKKPPIHYGDEQITPVCSYVDAEEVAEETDVSDGITYPVKTKEVPISEVVDETEVQITISSQSDTIEQNVVLSQLSKEYYEEPCEPYETFNKATDTDSFEKTEKKVQITDKKCTMCGLLDCKCKAGTSTIEETTDGLFKSTAEKTKHDQIKLIARDTIVKIFDFSHKSTLYDSNSHKCTQTVKKEQKKPLIKSKKVIPDPIPKPGDGRGDGMIVIKPIDDLKISSSTESIIEYSQS